MRGQFFQRIRQPRDFVFASGRKAFDLLHAQFAGGERTLDLTPLLGQQPAPVSGDPAGEKE